MPQPPKGVLQKTTHNPNTISTQHYSIVDDLNQSPCAMSSLEVLQSCPTQIKTLFSTIGVVDLNDTSLITFDLEQLTSWLPSHVSF